jgi:acetamidase/formamidase
MKTHALPSTCGHVRWNRDLPPALEIESGDLVEMELRDSSDGQVQPDWTTSDLSKLDRDRIHALTGPVLVKGAQPGDVLEVGVESIEHRGWGWSSLVPGLGLLPERFSKPFLFIWQLEQHWTRSLAPAVIPLRPFCGIMGVAPDVPGEHRTRPPGRFGGNLDIRDLGVGARLFLPVLVEGALFSAGDTHAAQGDGEVCINGIEMPAQARFRLVLHRGQNLPEPRAEIPPSGRPEHAGAWIFVASRPEFWPAAKAVVEQAIDFLVERYHLAPELAYILCSITLNLRVSQCVNQPMITLTGLLPKNFFPTETS